jgi:hypothetical protein
MYSICGRSSMVARFQSALSLTESPGKKQVMPGKVFQLAGLASVQGDKQAREESSFFKVSFHNILLMKLTVNEFRPVQSREYELGLWQTKSLEQTLRIHQLIDGD